jgi:uncharacterized protein (TIRG00374 family)
MNPALKQFISNNSKILNTFKYLIFLSIGVFLFSRVYKDYDIATFKNTLAHVKWGWIILSLILGLLSHLSRAIRWNMLIQPLGYKPRVINTFLSVMILYATNLVIPRGGEVARCTVLSRYEKIPFSKLAGTVVTERTTDMILLMILVFITIFSQIGIFKQFIENNPEFGQNFGFIFTAWFWILAVGFGIGGLFILWKLRNKLKKIKIIGKLFDLLYNFFEGIKSVKNLKNPFAFIAHSILIYVLYFFMMYVVFLSYPPTEHISLIAGLTAFIMGGLAMLMPVQGGIGAWHFMVIETLSIYGVDKIHGQDFALLSHTSMNLMLLIVGGLSFILLPALSKKFNKKDTINKV